MNKFRAFYNSNPLTVILFFAFLARLISSIFSRGYGMIDDQFLVIEPVQNWIDGQNIHGWLPDASNPDAKPAGFSMLYPGLHYYFFFLLEKIGIFNPESKMLVVRFIHALLSLLVVRFGYKIAEKLGGKTNAEYVGWMLALLWYIPMMSVRNLVEMVCIVPLIYATWLIVKSDLNQNKLIFWAGIFAGIAFSIRFQTATFIGGLGLVMFFQKRWLSCFAFGSGALLSIIAVQGGIDYFVWGQPFIQFQAYTSYNVANAYNYIIGPWYNYLLLIPGLMVPPLGLFLFFGFILSFRKHPMLFYPSLLFIVFHSFFPNKQERFILPVLPFVIIAGVLGWTLFVAQSTYWQNRKVLLRGLTTFSVVANLILLAFLSPASTRLSLVDSMIFLSDKPQNDCLIIENSNNGNDILLPRFYLRKWAAYIVIRNDFSASDLKKQIDQKDEKDGFKDFRYVLFGQSENLDKRVAEFETSFSKLEFVTQIESSYLDRFMHWLNPYGNKNQDYFIYQKKDR